MVSGFVNPDPAFWRGRRVALTGHTGFKGAWLALLLHRLGARVAGYALAPATEPNLFDAAQIGRYVHSTIADVRDAAAVSAWLQAFQPEVVLHLAAQALVRESYAQPVATFASNVMGTVHVLDAVRQSASVKAVLVVTTDKVYRNLENGQSYRESDELGGHDPYSASKAACELAVQSYRTSFLSGIGVATARAGNVIGGGDWSPERLLPDAVKAWQSGTVLQIRRPDAVRPWQHVLEPLSAYLVLAQRLFAEPGLGRAYNLGPARADAVSVREVIGMAQAAYGTGEVDFAGQIEGPHEAGLLHLDASLAQGCLGVQPRWPLATAIGKSMEWYRRFADGEAASDLCAADMAAFFSENTPP